MKARVGMDGHVLNLLPVREGFSESVMNEVNRGKCGYDVQSVFLVWGIFILFQKQNCILKFSS